ncbi:hypothetical protein N7523_010034 [Penicillium sp. IBT 18751x]|nr:hypothetical protein N7523_010034 [Penicillium sp. IBT 18751x]
MVLDLLRYAYTKTTRLEPINPTSATQLRENELRRLVVHYAACKVVDLARYHSPGDSEAATPTLRPVDFRKVERAMVTSVVEESPALLDMTPELASDLVRSGDALRESVIGSRSLMPRSGPGLGITLFWLLIS